MDTMRDALLKAADDKRLIDVGKSILASVPFSAAPEAALRAALRAMADAVESRREIGNVHEWGR